MLQTEQQELHNNSKYECYVIIYIYIYIYIYILDAISKVRYVFRKSPLNNFYILVQLQTEIWDSVWEHQILQGFRQ
jgi:hypothetical protein